ncbi:MAG TPA: protein-L-isoaspartate(D-aspartate) O-methyltransferase [Solirubrobacterales bacterium]|jgi:protein-L-isoaspartate(D-aspartate) O-methyltransferase|nr:protein-L-isoaspartate(D-aspartate) O-methyltransferase [Solirubrobacterales bacterium]
MTDFASLRATMVERQLRRRGIDDERVLAAMGEVPREEFVPERVRSRAYADSALPIGEEQTISQPWIVAAICQALALAGGERVLEIGSGSGYSAAVLSRLAGEVIGVERHEPLVAGARIALDRLGVENVELILGDGSRGLPERAPFEAIAVHATAPAPPRSLLGQLSDGGRLVVPIAAEGADMLTVFRRRDAVFERAEIGPCRFVPLIGEEGFAAG